MIVLRGQEASPPGSHRTVSPLAVDAQVAAPHAPAGRGRGGAQCHGKNRNRGLVFSIPESLYPLAYTSTLLLLAASHRASTPCFASTSDLLPRVLLPAGTSIMGAMQRVPVDCRMAHGRMVHGHAAASHSGATRGGLSAEEPARQYGAMCAHGSWPPPTCLPAPHLTSSQDWP